MSVPYSGLAGVLSCTKGHTKAGGRQRQEADIGRRQTKAGGRRRQETDEGRRQTKAVGKRRQ